METVKGLKETPEGLAKPGVLKSRSGHVHSGANFVMTERVIDLRNGNIYFITSGNCGDSITNINVNVNGNCVAESYALRTR